MKVVSKYSSNPEKHHWEAVKWILRYLRGTSDLPLCFGKADLVLRGNVDTDLAGDLDTRQSTTCYVYTGFDNSELGLTSAENSDIIHNTS